ncbi:MAG: corrinoid protein [Bacteroidota bacterium]
MDQLLEQLSFCVENGKVDKNYPYPPNMKGQDGADEYTAQALKENIHPDAILSQALIPAMDRVGEKFTKREIFVPQMLLSAKAMQAAMAHLKPYFQSGAIKKKGSIIIGTVKGDLHDIGKNLVSMMIEGSGWDIVELGVDVSKEKFINALEDTPDALVGLSALLTTTMVNMEDIVKAIKERDPKTKVLVGGAPVNDEFRVKIGADFYSPDPQGAIEYLKGVAV